MTTSMTGEEMWEALKTDGYVVIRGAVEAEKCEKIKSEFFDYIETLVPEFDRDDRSTWTNESLPVRTRGLLQHYGVGVQAHAVHSRTACAPYFKKLFPGKELTCSFDGTSFALRPKKFMYKNMADWAEHRYKDPIHIDQTTVGITSIQSGLAIVDQSENDRTFLVVPGSHLYHEEIMKLAPITPTGEWLIMTDVMREYLGEKGLVPTRVPMKAGDLVMWDSRTVHSSADFTKESDEDAYRIQVFVSFAPRLSDPKKYKNEVEKRRKAFAGCRTSKHSAQVLRLFQPQPILNNAEQYKKHEKIVYNVKSFSLDDMTEEEKVYHGLK